jgi:bifunctional DNA-binding transcriptional regulator/antitoxin component of YhaV-PrlF toxin-antitoxin module
VVTIPDILAERLGWRVADRLILEEMAGSSEVTSKTLQFFDENRRSRRGAGAYFKKLTGKRERPTDEFDLLINCDRIADPEWAADIVATAFRCNLGQ